MSSSVGSTTGSPTRLSGLVSGMDTDTLVKQMLSSDQAKIDKYEDQLQIDDWKTDAYRDITSSLQTFYNSYFNVTSSTNLKSEKSFSNYTTTYAATTSSNYVTVTGGAGAEAGTYTVKSAVKATEAMISGANASTGIISSVILNDNVSKISSANSNNIINVTLNGVTKQISLNKTGTINTVSALQAELQQSINDAFGKDLDGGNKITVQYTANAETDPTKMGGTLSFTPRDTDSFSISPAYNSGATALFNTESDDYPVTLTNSNNKFSLTKGSDTLVVTVPIQEYTSAADLASAIQTAARTAFGVPADDESIKFAADANGKITCTTGQTITKCENGAIAALGLTNSNLSNKIDLTAKLSDLNKSLSTPITTTSGNTVSFMINNKLFSFDVTKTSLRDIMDKVNGDASVGATIKYDSTNNTFSLKSDSTGVTAKVEAQNIGSCNLMTVLFGNTLSDTGTDASITINDGVSDKTILRSSNSIVYDGVTYEIKQSFESDTDSSTSDKPDPIVATLTSDTTKTYDFIKGFVDKYNELITKINDKLSEKKYRNYTPLSDDEKKELSDDQIEKWEEKAKSGLLRNDNILSSIVTSLRTTLNDAVAGTGISLSSIGITTSSDYTKKGQLVINDAKLKDALATKADQVTRLFTNTSDITYYETLGNSSLRKERYNESGIAQRLSDIIQDAVRTSTDTNGYKGTLLEKAGIVGDRSETTNIIFKEMVSLQETIDDLNDRLADKEDALYAKFTAMETAMNKMNSQQSYLTQMLGGS